MRGVFCLSIALFLSVPALAQEQGGALQGVVRDKSGGVLVAATVEARSPGAVGVTTTVTDTNGTYRFPALPPATYTITASLSGFESATSEAIIALGQMLTIDLSLQVAGRSESVVVVAKSPLIDVKQSAAFTTISRDVIEHFPGGADFTTVIPIAPGALSESRAGGLQMDGSSGSENRFIIDGMDTTDLSMGTERKAMLLDFIQEVQVKSSGYNAEFGGSTGGVLSAITKSGSNNFRGSVGVYNQGDWGYGARRGYHRFYPFTYKGQAANWTPEGTNCTTNGLMKSLGAAQASSVPSSSKVPGGAVASCVGSNDLLAPDDPWRYLGPVADLGGPVLKDKLWFYGGWSYTRNDYSRDAIFQNDPEQVNRHFAWRNYSNTINYNATSQVSNNIRIKFNGSNQKNKNRGTGPVLQPDNDPLGFTYNSNYPWIATGESLQGHTTAVLPFVNGQLDQGTFNRAYVLSGSDYWNNTYSGNVDWVVRPTIFINATAGYFYYNTTTPPEIRFNDIRYSYNNAPCGLLDVPASYCQANGWSNSQLSSSGTARNINKRLFINVNATYFRSLWGQHTFKAGLRFERPSNDVLSGATYPQVTLFWNQDYYGTRGRYGYYQLSQPADRGDVHSNDYSTWFQDTWSLNNKLTINAGVRMENEYIPSYKGNVPDCNVAPNDPNCAISIRFGMSDKIAPRLGFAYDVKGDSKWKAYGSYSWYYDMTKLGLPFASFGGSHWVNYYWTLDTYDYTQIRCGEGNAGCPGTFIGSVDLAHSSNQVDQIFETYFNRPGMTGIDPNLKPGRSGDYQLGLDHELNPTMSLGVRYIHKWQNRTIEDVGIFAPDYSSDPTGQSLVEEYLVANPGEGYAVQMEPRFPSLIEPRPKRDYDAFEVHFRKRLTHSWAADASYTYSRLYGNYPGLASSDEWGRTSPNVNRLWDNTVVSYDINQHLVYGVLNTDRPHQFKLSASYDFNFGTSVGAFWVMESGLPNSTVFRAGNGAGFPVFPYRRNDMGRLPYYRNLDVVLTHQVKLGGNKRVALQASFTNALDLKTVTNYYYTTYGNVLTNNRVNIGLPITYFYAGALGTYLTGQTYPAGAYTVENAAYLYTLPRAAGGAYGGTLWDNPFYGVPDQYQGRRQIRISAKFTF